VKIYSGALGMKLDSQVASIEVQGCSANGEHGGAGMFRALDRIR